GGRGGRVAVAGGRRAWGRGGRAGTIPTVAGSVGPTADATTGRASGAPITTIPSRRRTRAIRTRADAGQGARSPPAAIMARRAPPPEARRVRAGRALSDRLLVRWCQQSAPGEDGV